MRRIYVMVFLAWSCAALAWSVGRRLANPATELWADAPPVLWRHGHLAVLQLEQAIGAARALIPPGAVVAFACARDGDQYFAYHWASFLLPEREVVDLRDVPDLRGVTYVLRDTRVDDPRLRFARRLPAGWYLFRVRGAAPS